MSDDSTMEAPATDVQVVEPAIASAESASTGDQTAIGPAATVAPTGRGIKPGTWIAAVAAALVLAVMLSGVSFGTGVIVGRHSERFGDRGAAGAAAVNGYGQPQTTPGFALPERLDGRRMMPDQPGRRLAPQGMPGQGMRGGRGPWDSESGTTTPSPFGE